MRCYLIWTIVLVNISTIANCAFENMDFGARPLGMGSAYVSVADNAGAIFWNPAGIAQVNSRELTMSYMELYNLVSYSSISYAGRLKSSSMGLGLFSSSDVDGIYRELEIILSFARKIHRDLGVGANAKYLSVSANTGNIRIGGGKGLSVDAGCQYRLFSDLVSLGVSFQNLAGYVSYYRKVVMGVPDLWYSQRPDFSYKIGADVNIGYLLPPIKDTILAIELSDGDFHAGAEYTFRDIISIRSGFRTGNSLTRSITIGFGLKASSVKFDYAFVGSNIGAQISQFTVSVNW